MFSPRWSGYLFRSLQRCCCLLAQAQDNKPEFTLTVAQIYDEYQANAASIEKYKRKTVQISGFVLQGMMPLLR